MTSFDLISMGIKNLLRRKARTILTVLGVVIGTASIVVMLSLGLAMNHNFETELAGMGSLNIIEVYSNKYAWYGEEEENQNRKIAKLDDKAVREISAIENVTAVLPLKEDYYTVKAGRNLAGISLKITDMSKIDMLDLKIEEGYIPDGRAKYELLFGSQIENFFYNPRSRDWRNRPEVDVMSETLYIAKDFWNIKGRGVKVTATGKLKETNGDQDWSVYMDIKAFEELEKKLKRSQKDNGSNGGRNNNNQDDKYSSFKVKVEDLTKVSGVSQILKDMGFQANSLTDVLDSMKETSAGIRAMLGGIGAVSLFVAAIGITNTMVMSIYERTREIGVMKVLGAELGDIKKLFLFEAAIIGFVGGLTGIAFSFGISYVLNNTGVDIMGGTGGGMGYYGSPEEVKKLVSLIPTWLAGSSVVFATVVGVVSGYYPAVRAMNLSALEAIRNE